MKRTGLLILLALMAAVALQAANDSIKQRILDSYVRYGERYIGCKWESPSATLFAEFKTNGNRTRYEQWTFGKRRQLAALVLAEKVEGKGRFMPDIVNGIMSTLEETWWGIPAHYGTKVMRPEDQNVDLFNAETAGLMAWTRHALQQQIDSFSPFLSQRIDSEIERRMLIPALNTNYWWKKASMNWNPWICSNWLACVKFCEHDSVRREKALTQIASAMNAFADGYPDDGGCDEGPTYWDRAAASLYECASMMPNSQSLPASFLSSLKKMAAYCYATYIADGYCLSFADSHGNRLVQQPNVMYPFALYVDDPVMCRFAKYIAVEKGFLEDTASLYAAVTRQLLRDFRLYMLVGGMPQAVSKYIETNDLGAVDAIKREILELYADDFRKIDPTGKATKMFYAIPGQLNSNATRYQLSSVVEQEHNYEIDFLLSRGSKVCPIEVKSSGYKTHASLDAFMKKYPERTVQGYLLYTKDMRKDSRILLTPVFMTMFL